MSIFERFIFSRKRLGEPEGVHIGRFYCTLESRESVIELKKDFQILSSKSIVAIIYTHNHADHVFGTQIFDEENLQNIKISAHSKTLEILDKTMNLFNPLLFKEQKNNFELF